MRQPGPILTSLYTVVDNDMELENRYRKDPELLELVEKKLLEPGWAGELDRLEFAYVKALLKASPSFKRRWGFRPTAKRLSEAKIRSVARSGVSVIKKVVLASVAKHSPLTK
jgi:hypothetical protein